MGKMPDLPRSGSVLGRLALLLLSGLLRLSVAAQSSSTDTVITSAAYTLHSDKRLEQFGQKMAEYNESLALKVQLVNGYRLMVINTSDRNQAMQVRSSLIRLFPEHKMYMVFQSPNIRIKIGNFTDKAEAEKVRKQLLEQNVVGGNVYVVAEKVELKPTDRTAAPVEE